MSAHARVMPTKQERLAVMFFRVVKGNTLLRVFLDRGKLSKRVEGSPLGVMGLQQKAGVWLASSKAKQFLPQVTCSLQLSAPLIKPP